MVIQNSEVTMASKGCYSTATKVDVQINQTPAFKINDVVIEKPEEEEGVESMASNKQARMSAMTYLLRMLLLSRIFGEDSSFNELLNQLLGEGNGYTETTTVNYECTRTQEVSFIAKGTAVTADGRMLQFDYGFEMSDSFHEEYQSINQVFKSYIDPLIINLDDKPTKMSDQLFYFDLDGDGEKEEISQLSKGSGLLALDKNEDGIINDGLELFGPATGDGFKELMEYDKDGNGWIDENDPIFEKLRVWSMNESGEMELYTLKESDVGAIYLGRVATEFMDTDDADKARAIIRESGIYLHESDGHAGSVQHIDFAT